MRHKPSVLIVDDEPLNLRVSAECLANDYVIFFARSGKEALEILSARSVELILLDIYMPEMDGFETADRIAALDACGDVPIIYLTADTSEETISKAFDRGASDYIIKPFKQKELLARVRNRIETERLKRGQRQLIEQNEHLMQIIKTHVAYLKTDAQGIITEISRNFCELFFSIREDMGRCVEKMIGSNINVLKSQTTDRKVYEALWHTIQTGQTFSHEIEDCNFNGGTNWYRVTISPDMDEKGSIWGYIAFYHNIDEKIRFEHEATTDFLTGLYNRTKFEKELETEIARSLRYRISFSVVLVDIDHFKEVNDRYGHATGDLVLQAFAAILAHNIRQSDTLARWGGEEFIILCPHTRRKGAADLAENLRREIEKHRFATIGSKTASFGVVEFDETMNAKTLFNRVDTALYSAKLSGRNRVTVSL